jgi:hypothetical protein
MKDEKVRRIAIELPLPIRDCRTGSKFDNDSLTVITLNETDLKHHECHVAVAIKLLSDD